MDSFILKFGFLSSLILQAHAVDHCFVQPKTESYKPDAQTCASANQNLTLDDAAKIAHLYAPILYHHPLEKYHLTDPTKLGEWDGAAEGKWGIYKGDKKLYNLTNENLYKAGRPWEFDYDHHYNPDELYLQYNYTNGEENLDPGLILNTTRWKAGADFFPNGTSKAPITYNVMEYDNNTWVFNYHIYFSFNGCSILWLKTVFDKEPQDIHFSMCSLGMHEGDWESISVMVCKNEDGSVKPLAIRYGQHGWNWMKNCEKNECTLQDNHPIGYIALTSHAIYPEEHTTIPYGKIRVPIVYNIRNLYLTDNIAKDENKRFVPHSENVIRIPDLQNISMTNQPWAGFTGSWGLNYPNKKNFMPECFNDNITEVIECPFKNPVFDIMLDMFGVDRVKNYSKIRKDGAKEINVTEPWLFETNLRQNKPIYFNIVSKIPVIPLSEAPSGPTRHSIFWDWEEARSSPEIFPDEFGDICPNSENWRDTSSPYSSLDQLNDYVVSLMALIGLFIGSAVILGFLLVYGCRPLPTRALGYSQHTSLLKLQKYSPIWIVFSYCLLFIGFFMMAVAIDVIVVDLFSKYFQYFDWSVILVVLYVFGILVLVIPCGIAAFVSTCMHIARCKLARGKPATKWLAWSLTMGGPRRHHAFVIFNTLTTYCCMFLSTFFSFIALVIGGIYYGLSLGCEVITPRIPEGTCLDLEAFGYWEGDLLCKDNVMELCNTFGGQYTNVLIWGAVLMLLASYYLYLLALSWFWHYKYDELDAISEKSTLDIASRTELSNSSEISVDKCSPKL